MTFPCTDRISRYGLIVLVLFALVLAPFVNAGASIASFTVAGKKDAGKCDKMQKMDAEQSQQVSSNCCDQYSDCKTHCQNLLLSHLPVTALFEPFSFQPRSLRSVQLSSSQILKGVFPPLDPRPPQI